MPINPRIIFDKSISGWRDGGITCDLRLGQPDQPLYFSVTAHLATVLTDLLRAISARFSHSQVPEKHLPSRTACHAHCRNIHLSTWWEQVRHDGKGNQGQKHIAAVSESVIWGETCHLAFNTLTSRKQLQGCPGVPRHLWTYGMFYH